MCCRRQEFDIHKVWPDTTDQIWSRWDFSTHCSEVDVRTVAGLGLAVVQWMFLHKFLLLLFQEPSASSPSVPALLASILSSLVTHGTCMACLTTLATAMVGPCSAPGEVLASRSLLASSALWLPLFSRYPDPPAPSPGKRTALSAKAGSREKTNWTHRFTEKLSPVHSSPVSPGYRFFLCVCV